MTPFENDPTRTMARPAVIVAAIRSGGTFLAHCLSSHPAVFCDRGESLHHGSVWFRSLSVKRPELLHCLVHMQGYQVSMCKLTYGQALEPGVWAYLLMMQPLVLWLRRDNLIRQAVSVLLNKMARRGTIRLPQHSFEPVKPVQVSLPAAAILRTARGLARQDGTAAKWLTRLHNVLPVTYAGIVGGERHWTDSMMRPAALAICQFLEVNFQELSCGLKAINGRRLSETLSNWPEVEAAVRESEFAGWLADE